MVLNVRDEPVGIWHIQKMFLHQPARDFGKPVTCQISQDPTSAERLYINVLTSNLWLKKVNKQHK